MEQQDDAANQDYPHGRGYGHDYMRGGEVFGGYGYAQREEYSRPRGDLTGHATEGVGTAESTDAQLHRSQ
jgi:hypothetical protein